MGQTWGKQSKNGRRKNKAPIQCSKNIANAVDRTKKMQQKTVELRFDKLDERITELLLARNKAFYLGIAYSPSWRTEHRNRIFQELAFCPCGTAQEGTQTLQLNAPANINIRLDAGFHYNIQQQNNWICGIQTQVFHFMVIGAPEDVGTTLFIQFASKVHTTPLRQLQSAVQTVLSKGLNSTLASHFQSVCPSLEYSILKKILHRYKNISDKLLLNMRILISKDGSQQHGGKINLRFETMCWQDRLKECVVRARSLAGKVVRVHREIEPHSSLGWFVWFIFQSCRKPERRLWELYLICVENAFQTGHFYEVPLAKLLVSTASIGIKNCDFESGIVYLKWSAYLDEIELNLTTIDSDLYLEGVKISYVTIDSISATTAVFVREYNRFLAKNRIKHLSPQYQQQFEEQLAIQVDTRVDLLVAWSVWCKLHCSPWFKKNEWVTYVHGMMDSLEICFSRCGEECVYCSLKCMEVACHQSICADVHNCWTDHKCKYTCEACAKGFTRNYNVAPCCKTTSHSGKHVCMSFHECDGHCENSDSPSCAINCFLPYDHEGEHACGVSKHACPSLCQASGCNRTCIEYVENEHEKHACRELRCKVSCAMPECSQRCASLDHFHGDVNITDDFRLQRIRQIGATGVHMSEYVDSGPHQCNFSHQCPKSCDLPGMCVLQVRDPDDNVVRIIESALVQYTWKDLQLRDLSGRYSDGNGIASGVRLVAVQQRCLERLLPRTRSHEGIHRCSMNVRDLNGEINSMRYGSPHRDFERAIRTHFCEERCPRCGGFCIHSVGHHGQHTTIHTVSAKEQTHCIEYCCKRSHEHYIDCQKLKRCPFSAYGECGIDTVHRVPHSCFWSLLRWQDPSLRKYKAQVDAAQEDQTQNISNGQLSSASYFKGREISETVSQQHFIFALDCSDTMRGNPWKDMLVSLHSFIHRMSPTRVECDAKLWRECNYDVISVLTFSREARWICTEMSLQQFSECDQAIPYRGGKKRYSAAVRLIGQALKKLEHKRYLPVVFICTDGKKGERFKALDGLAENFRKRHSDGLSDFKVVGYGDMHLSFLMDFACRLGALCTTKI